VLGTLVYLGMARHRPTIARWCDGLISGLHCAIHGSPAVAALGHAYPAIIPLRSDIHRPFDKPTDTNSGISGAVCQMSNNDPAKVGAEPDFWSPMFRLIEAQRKKLGLGKAEIVRRCGCKNASKGIRWLEVICSGDTSHPRAREILERLPAALEIDQVEFDNAVAETERQITVQRAKEEAEREADMRARFEPHGIFVTECSVPSQIVICGLTGGPEKWLRIELDLSQSPITYVQQAINHGRQNPVIPFFGRVREMVINYSFDLAVRYDLNGNPIEWSNRPYTPGEIELSSRGRDVGPALRQGLGL
jgi:hypothetical protein